MTALFVYLLLVFYACWMKPMWGCLEGKHKMYLQDSFEYKGGKYYVRECRSKDLKDTFPNYSYERTKKHF